MSDPTEPCQDDHMGSKNDGPPADVTPTPEEAPADPEAGDEPREGFDRWRNESAIGGIGTGIARGLQSVFGSPRQEIAIVAEVPGEPPDADKRLRVILDPDDPTKSIAVMPAPPTDSTQADSTPADPPPA
jgi:hypothetical protein